MNEANKIKLGAFLTVTATLLVVSFIAVGTLKLFERKLHAMTLLETSAEGLAVGSPVKYMGIRVGRINRMAMRGTDGKVAVYFELSSSALEDDGDPDDDDLSFDSGDLRILRDRNMISCYVNSASIMGGSFLELSIQEPEPGKTSFRMPPKVRPRPGVIYIPARSSHIGNAIQNVSRLLEDLQKAKLAETLNNLNNTLNNLNRIVGDPEFAGTVHKLNDVATQMNTVFSPENTRRINDSIRSLESTSTQLLALLNSEESKKLVGDLHGFLRDARSLIGTAHGNADAFTRRAVALKERLEESLNRLDNTMMQFSAVMARLDDDPSQFVRGRKADDKR